MTKKSSLPLVGVPACVRDVDGQPFHTVGDKYVRALAISAGVAPLMIPSLGEDLVDLRRLVRALDGIMMTGSPSNVHPSHYGRTATIEAEPFDPARDSTSLALIRLALRSEEHTSELQSLMRISYAVFCWKKK